MKHSLQEVRREYDRLDRRCGVDTRGITLSVSMQAMRRLGQFRPGPPMQIVLSAFLMDADPEAFLDTIRHEYAHALVFLREPGSRHGHDAVWKAACREVGCRPKSTAAPTEAQQELRESRAHYRVVCKGCGAESLYLREGKIVKLLASGKPGAVTCTRCGGKAFELYRR